MCVHLCAHMHEMCEIRNIWQNFSEQGAQYLQFESESQLSSIPDSIKNRASKSHLYVCLFMETDFMFPSNIYFANKSDIGKLNYDFLIKSSH